MRDEFFTKGVLTRIEIKKDLSIGFQEALVKTFFPLANFQTVFKMVNMLSQEEKDTRALAMGLLKTCNEDERKVIANYAIFGTPKIL